MMLEIPQVLSGATLAAVQDFASRGELFESGTKSAGWHAQSRKHNLQANRAGLAAGVLKKIEEAVMNHSVVQVAAQPRALVELMLSRYEPGMFYGNHVDNALMHGQRTDLSFTLFISPPDTYQGGELVIDETAGERHIKLDAGSLFLYPSSSLHRVNEVSAGARLVAVGWFSSYVRDPFKREILFDLERSIAALRESEARGEAGAAGNLALLLKTRSNLLRLWAET